MDPKYWHEKWKVSDIKFNQDKPHRYLVEYGARLTKGKIMVPLCGKSIDLIWLSKNGFDVVGAEISPIACDAFFTENALTFERIKQENFVLYRGENISIWCGDFFALPSEAWTGCNVLYDRAALVALPVDIRKKYAEHLTKIEQMLLISFDYQQDLVTGPPFSVPESEIRQLFSESFEIEKLTSNTNNDLSGRTPKYENVTVTENAYFLTKRSS